MTQRGRYVAAAAAIVVAVLLAFAVAKLTTKSPAPRPVATAGDTPSDTVSDTPSESASETPSATPTGTPTPSPTPSVSVTSGTPTPTVSATPTATPTPTPTPTPVAPLTVGQLVKQLPECATAKCKVISTIASSQSGPPLRFALVQLPVSAGSGGEVPLRAALFDTLVNKLTWKSAVLTGVPATGADGGAKQDSTGHVAFTLFVGAHSSSLFVLDPADGIHVQWFGMENAGGNLSYFSNTPGAHAQDLDGDGVLEIVMPENDGTPDYASGNTTVYRFAWDGGKSLYFPSTCTYYPSGSKTGTDYDASDPKCAAG